MNITREEIGTLNEVLKLNLTPEDYKEKFETELKKVQKNMTLPGFRPGHVPAGIVRKRYGKAVLIEELNKIVSESLDSFVKETNLDLLGSPLPHPSADALNNFDEPGEFTFAFEIGLAPQFTLTLPPAKVFDYYMIEPDDKMVEDRITDLRRKYGKFTNPENITADSILYGDFTELDVEGNAKDEGITNRSTLALNLIKDETLKKTIYGLKKGDSFRMNMSTAFGDNRDEIAHMLNITPEKAKEITSDFEFGIESVNHIEPAEFNTEFFDKVYGEGIVTTEEQFREKVRDDMRAHFAHEGDMKLKHDIEDHLLSELDIKLPDAFLQKWLQTGVEEPLSPERVEKEYPGYARGMKLRLIETRIFREQNMQINPDEVKNMAREYVYHQFSQYGSGLTPELIDSLAERYLQKRENVERYIEILSDRKVFLYLKTIVKTNIQKVSIEEFAKIVKDHHHH